MPDWVMSIDKRFKYNNLNQWGKENFYKFVQAKDNTRILIEILTSYECKHKCGVPLNLAFHY